MNAHNNESRARPGRVVRKFPFETLGFWPRVTVYAIDFADGGRIFAAEDQAGRRLGWRRTRTALLTHVVAGVL